MKRYIKAVTYKSLAYELSSLDDEYIRDYYFETFPTDDLGNDLNDITFADLLDALINGKDVYATIGSDDSIIRERLLDRLSELTGIDYDTFYDFWLYGDKTSASEKSYILEKELSRV